MKRLLYAATLAMIAMSVLAPTALAQQGAQTDSFLNTGGGACPEGFVAGGDYCYTPEDSQAIQNNPFLCEGIISPEEFLSCLEANVEDAPDQQDQASTSNQAQAPSTTQQTPATTNDTQVQEMPDTGGPGLLGLVAALLIGSGILGLAWSQRRSL